MKKENMILFNTDYPFFLLDETIYVALLFSPVCSTKNENQKPQPKENSKKGKLQENVIQDCISWVQDSFLGQLEDSSN